MSDPMQPALLTTENYKKGFLIDDDVMAGVAQDPEGTPEHTKYLAFLINHLTGEYLACESFFSLEEALATVNRLERDWVYEAAGGCGNGNCQKGNCQGGNCGRKAASDREAGEEIPCSTGACATT